MFKRSTLTAILISALTACGGSSSSSTPEPLPPVVPDIPMTPIEPALPVPEPLPPIVEPEPEPINIYEQIEARWGIPMEDIEQVCESKVLPTYYLDLSCDWDGENLNILWARGGAHSQTWAVTQEHVDHGIIAPTISIRYPSWDGLVHSAKIYSSYEICARPNSLGECNYDGTDFVKTFLEMELHADGVSLSPVNAPKTLTMDLLYHLDHIKYNGSIYESSGIELAYINNGVNNLQGVYRVFYDILKHVHGYASDDK